MPNLFTILLCLTLCVPTAFAQPAPPRAADEPVQIVWDQKVAMRDGVRLSVTLYRDPARTQRVPAIVAMTPYIASREASHGLYFAQHGYVFVAVDARGRGNSDGKFVPGQVEGRDGYDIVEWAARQPWCDGQVAMLGGSWLGFTQWAIAKERPPHLKAIAPTAAAHLGVDFPQDHGFFSVYVLRWLSYVYGHALNAGLFENDDLWANVAAQHERSGRPFQDLEAITGVTGTVFRTWLAHPREDAFWTALTPSAADYAKLTLPVLTITGAYDGDQLGALTYYERHMAYGAKDVTARHQLVIGPWDHPGTRKPQPELGGVTFGPSAVMSMDELHTAWYDHVLKGAPAPAFLKDRVACFIMGRNVWIYASKLSEVEGDAMKLELDLSGATAGDVMRGGSLRAAPATAAAAVTLLADPRAAIPRDPESDADSRYLRNQRTAYRDAPSRVVLHSAPFTDEVILAGRPRLHLQLTVDQPDADVNAELSEVLPNGESVNLGDVAVRLRYRRGGVAAVPMVPGKAELVDFPVLPFFARAIAKGSRLRLVLDVGPWRSLQRNTHTGGNLATEPVSAGRLAKLTVMTGPGTGSLLELPQPDPALLRRNADALRGAGKP